MLANLLGYSIYSECVYEIRTGDGIALLQRFLEEGNLEGIMTTSVCITQTLPLACVIDIYFT